MNCKQKDNAKTCSCTYSGCPRKGICCDCISYHLANQELPGCCFPPAAEKTYDRSFAAFARAQKLG
jgi:hypothetical protein